jgi:hypothetical protein
MSMTAALVRSILGRWQAYEWTIQGFGFARTKIADIGRIHIWDSRLATQLVSTMHTHPWPLRSTIISGELINHRFTHRLGTSELPYIHSRLKTGEGGALIGEPEPIALDAHDPEFYAAGESYSQLPEEIHRTMAQDGTVTLLERPQGPPLEEASVYWPAGMSWVSAEPRKPRSEYELQPIVTLALARWCSTSAKGGVKP